MAKFQSPLLGYNNNVRHKGRVFHIQTEDSGVNHPHIITHLFMDGGRILKSVKRSYAEHVGTDGMNETVRQMMKEQHKAMFIALRDGQFDALAFGGSQQKVEVPAIPQASPPGVAAPAAPAAPASPAAPPAAASPSVPAPAAVFPDEAATTTDGAPSPDSAPPTINEQHLPPPARVSARPAPRLELAETDEVPAAHPPPAAGHARAPAVVVDYDYAAVERDAQVTPQTPTAGFQTNDLPPPPKNLFTKEPGTGTYRSVTADAPREERASATKSSRPAATGSEARYAPARPAAIFGAKPAQQPSIFSDDLVSDKSLDEVILSYLAEDLEPPRRK